MTEITEIRSALSNAPKSLQAAFAVACAERTAIVFHRLAAKSSVAEYDAVLDAAWEAVKTRTPIPTKCRKSLASLPEAEIDDSDRREHYATLTMGVLEHALDVLDASNASDSADLTCCQALDLYSCFDAIVLGSPSMVIDPANPAPSGPLESAEAGEQAETLRILGKSREGDVEVCDRLRQRAKSASQILDSAITTLIQSRP